MLRQRDDRMPPESRKEAIEDIEAEADRLHRLAEDLLVMSRAHGGNLPVNPRTVDLSDFLNEVVSRFGSRAEASGVALSADVPTSRSRGIGREARVPSGGLCLLAIAGRRD